MKDIRRLVDNGEFLANKHCKNSPVVKLITTLLLELITDHSREVREKEREGRFVDHSREVERQRGEGEVCRILHSFAAALKTVCLCCVFRCCQSTH